MSCQDSFGCIILCLYGLWTLICRFFAFICICCRQKHQAFSDNGLPNIGNTCYLNATLQILFSAEKLRQNIINLSKKNGQKLVFHRLLSNVFQSIVNKKSDEEKRQQLGKLLSYLSTMHPEIVRYQQNDVNECLLSILNILQDQEPRNSKLAFFKVSYQSKCGCSNEGTYMEEYLLALDRTCSNCRKPIQFRVVSSGNYILVLPKQSFKLDIQFNENRSKQILYKIKGFITYFGNQRSGHYISKRKEGEVWLQINDASVQNLGTICSDKTIPMIALYEKAQLMKQINQ